MNTTGNEIFMVAAKVKLSKSQVAAFGLHLRPPETIILPQEGVGLSERTKSGVFPWMPPTISILSGIGSICNSAVGEFVYGGGSKPST